MRLRKSAHRPSAGSISHAIPNGRTVRLLPLSTIGLATWGRASLSDRVKRAAVAANEQDQGVITLAIQSLIMFLLWDDPDVEWALSADPDALIDGPDEGLLSVGIDAAREWLGLGTARIFSLEELSLLRDSVFGIKRDEPPAPKEEPSPGEQ